jgi:glycosyltransferase involved in cell wall biosynthesis
VKPMKVAMISEHAGPLATVNGLGGPDGGGQNVFVADLATELGRQGHEVTVFTRRDDPDLPRTVPFATNVWVEHVPAGPARTVPKDDLLRWMPDLGRYLEHRWAADPPDVAHAHFWMSGLATLRAAARLGIPVAQTYHALGTVKRRHQGDKDTSPPERIRLERAIGRGADAVIATCADEVAELTHMGVPRGRVSIVPCGVDLDRFHPGTADSAPPSAPAPASAPGGGAPRLVALSRLVERKGVDTAIEALIRVPEAELVVAGGPPAEEMDADPEVHRLRLCAKEAGVADRVDFLGRVARDRVPALLRSADLAVTLPWYEPFGMVPLEAMACGVPVVASAVGGHLDTVVDHVTGVHVPPRRPVETARRVRELLADPTRRQAYGIAAADRARSRFSWERVGGETAEIYERILAGRG